MDWFASKAAENFALPTVTAIAADIGNSDAVFVAAGAVVCVVIVVVLATGAVAGVVVGVVVAAVAGVVVAAGTVDVVVTAGIVDVVVVAGGAVVAVVAASVIDVVVAGGAVVAVIAASVVDVVVAGGAVAVVLDVVVAGAGAVHEPGNECVILMSWPFPFTKLALCSKQVEEAREPQLVGGGIMAESILGSGGSRGEIIDIILGGLFKLLFHYLMHIPIELPISWGQIHIQCSFLQVLGDLKTPEGK